MSEDSQIGWPVAVPGLHLGEQVGKQLLGNDWKTHYLEGEVISSADVPGFPKNKRRIKILRTAFITSALPSVVDHWKNMYINSDTPIVLPAESAEVIRSETTSKYVFVF